jgi:hypothetical protein
MKLMFVLGLLAQLCAAQRYENRSWSVSGPAENGGSGVRWRATSKVSGKVAKELGVRGIQVLLETYDHGGFAIHIDSEVEELRCLEYNHRVGKDDDGRLVNMEPKWTTNNCIRCCQNVQPTLPNHKLLEFAKAKIKKLPKKSRRVYRPYLAAIGIKI